MRRSAPVMASIDDVVAKAVAPHAVRNDAGARFPREAMDALGAAGFLGLMAPVSHGGAGMGPSDVVGPVAAIAEADPSAAMVYLMHLAGTACLRAAPPTKKRDAVLEEIVAGHHLTTLAFSEAGSRSHFWAAVSQERRDGDRRILQADKSFVTSAGHADSYVVSTRDQDGTRPTDTTLYLVPKEAPGVQVGDPWAGMGLRGNASAPVRFEVSLHEDDKLSGDGEAFPIKLGVVLPVFNLGSAAVALGICRAVLQRTKEHLMTSRFEHMDAALASALPNLRAAVARMKIQTDALEGLIGQTARAVNEVSEDATLNVLQVKAAGAETAIAVTQTAMRSCGGSAYAGHVGIDRYFRDAQAAAVMAPTTDVLYDLIGRTVLGMPMA